MHCFTNITSDYYWVGASDRKLELFENLHEVPTGISYNSYLLKDEKTVLFDTVDASVAGRFFENIEAILGERTLDYVIVQHMEPDHSATLGELVKRYPNVKIVANSAAIRMIQRFFGNTWDDLTQEVKENDILNTGKHEMTFLFAPMVHWPEVMVTYDKTSEMLFSADAFGTFGAVEGSIFADDHNFEVDWVDEARRYYTNIVGKYGANTLALLKKIEALKISYLCPLHGPVWRENISWYISKYEKWASYTPEEESVLIVYGTVYGNTENAVRILANYLVENGVNDVHLQNVSQTDPSYILADCFRYSYIVFASSTFNAGIFPKMETLLLDLKAHSFQKRKYSLLQNGTWAPTAGKHMEAIITSMKDMELVGEMITIPSVVNDETKEEIEALAKIIAKNIAI